MRDKSRVDPPHCNSSLNWDIRWIPDVVFIVEGMTCEGCTRHVSECMLKHPALVEAVQVTLDPPRAKVYLRLHDLPGGSSGGILTQCGLTPFQLQSVSNLHHVARYLWLIDRRKEWRVS